MASCTAVRVRERGRFCVCVVRERLLRFGRGRMRREATMRTWRSGNFFSSSRVRLGVELVFVVHEVGRRKEVYAPLLDLVEAGERWDGDEDDDGFAAVSDFDLRFGGKRILVSAKVLLASAHRLFVSCVYVYVCVFVCSFFISKGNSCLFGVQSLRKSMLSVYSGRS